MYDLKDYLNSINYTKENLLDSEDEMWEKKYPPFIVNRCLSGSQDTWVKATKLENLEYVKEFYGYNNEKAKVALTILNDKQIATIKEKLYKGGRNGRS